MLFLRKVKFIALMIILIALAIVIYEVSDFSKLAVVKDNITSQQSSASVGSFKAKEFSKLKVSYNSYIKEGTLKLSLIDSNKKIIQEFEVNSKSSKELAIDKDDEYTLSANYNDFIGEYNISVKED